MYRMPVDTQEITTRLDSFPAPTNGRQNYSVSVANSVEANLEVLVTTDNTDESVSRRMAGPTLTPEQEVYRRIAERLGGHVLVRATVLGGMPVVSGTRIPVSGVLQKIIEKGSVESVMQQFAQLSREQIINALDFAAEVMDFGA